MNATHNEIKVDTLDKALAEIERLKAMMSVARVVRLEVSPPEMIDGNWRMNPVITSIGIDEQAFTQEVGMILAACFVKVLMEAQKDKLPTAPADKPQPQD